ncbi:MAG: aldolase/citrate lyase family protein, partial [Aurantimicrobium sp.]
MVSAEISRSWLLVNGSHSEEFDAAAVTKADQIVLDIEDAVDPSQKAQSRAAVAKWLETKQAWVRINDRSSDFWSDDIDELRDIPGLLGVMLAKTEDGSHVTETFDR